MGLIDTIAGNSAYLNPVTAVGKVLYDEDARRTRHAIGDAQPSEKEKALEASISSLVKQAIQDRKFTRDKILAEMGYKIVSGPDGKPQITQLSDDERRALMTPTEQTRSKSAQVYMDRAKAALSGTTQLPSFLRQEVDTQKEQEATVLKQLLGDGYENSAAAKQAMDVLKKREEAVRENVQQQDKAVSLANANQLKGLNRAASNQRVAGYNNLTDYIGPNVNNSAGLLGYFQGIRNQDLQRKLDELQSDRKTVGSILTLGGMLGGGAMTYGRQASPASSSSYPVVYTGSTYQDPSLPRLY